MVLIAQVMADGGPVESFELGVFAGDECREAALTDENGMVFITIPGDEPCELHFRVSDGNSEFVINNSELHYETDTVIGSPRAPFIINLGEATGIWSVATQSQQTEQTYDLQGRKVDYCNNAEGQKLRKGVYIVNGRKKVR